MTVQTFKLANFSDLVGGVVGAGIPVLNDQSGGNYVVLASDSGKWVQVGGFTYTLPAASTFGNTFAVLFINTTSSTATINTTSSVFLGAGSASSLLLLAGTWAWCNSNAVNWVTVTK